MRQGGNPDQWRNGYPSEEIVMKDIKNGDFYVEEEKGMITGCFAFIIGDEPTYQSIDGYWPDNKPYGTIHRLASGGETTGLGARCISFCRELSPTLRADTHHLNHPMKHILERAGFRYCGIIHVADGSPRLAFQC